MLAKSKWLKSKDIEKRETQDFHPSVRYDGDRYDQKNDQTGREIHPSGRLCQDHGAHQPEQSDEKIPEGWTAGKWNRKRMKAERKKLKRKINRRKKYQKDGEDGQIKGSMEEENGDQKMEIHDGDVWGTVDGGHRHGD